MDLKRRLLALVLGLLFGMYITPKEIVHVFQSHTDTEHHGQDGLRIESAHHHCFLLKADQALSSIEPPSFLSVPEPKEGYFMPSYTASFISKPLQGNYLIKKSRGPPNKRQLA
jgi:hypothetical protein